jgi:hypothetical protein
VKLQLDASDLPTLRKLEAQQRSVYANTRGKTTSFGTRLLLTYLQRNIALVESRCHHAPNEEPVVDAPVEAVAG